MVPPEDEESLFIRLFSYFVALRDNLLRGYKRRIKENIFETATIICLCLHLLMKRAKSDSIILDARLCDRPKDSQVLLPGHTNSQFELFFKSGKICAKKGKSEKNVHLCWILRSSIRNCQSSDLRGPSTVPLARLIPSGSAKISHLDEWESFRIHV